MSAKTKEQAPALSEMQCQMAAANGWSAGHMTARLFREVTTAELKAAFKFYGITYRKRNNHCTGRQPKTTK
jgi:hypothetical protein